MKVMIINFCKNQLLIFIKSGYFNIIFNSE